MCIAPDKDDAKRQPLQSHYCDGFRLGLRPHLSRQGHLLVVTTWSSRRRNPQNLVQESVWQSHSVHMQFLEGRHGTLGALSD